MKHLIKQIIEQSIEKAGFELPADFAISEPPKKEAGDWAINVALLIAGKNKENPREVASKIEQELIKDKDVEKVEIAGPGFLNITLKNEIYFLELNKILAETKDYGRSNIGKDKKANVEYISANPTGPLHVGNARSGPIGEAVANLLEFYHHKVEREFYVNNIGVQIGRFGRSLAYWYQIKSKPELAFPEDGYPGGYIKEISEQIQAEKTDAIKKISNEDELTRFFADEGLKFTIASIKADAELLGIHFDRFSFEGDFYNSGKSEEVIKELTEKGVTAEKDGALWFKRPDDPDLADKDSVLIKSDEKKTLTYFANDIAYHIDKIKRSDFIIDVWGANHFVHIPRIKSALQALGFLPEKIKIIVYQYVRLKKSGIALSMGKRLGNFITLRAVIEAGVAPDAFKYFIISQNPNTPIDFDIELAADTSEKNPVYYIKYAHARICSILRKAGETDLAKDPDFNLLEKEEEKALYKELVKFPDLIKEAYSDLQIQTIPHFAYKIAGLFHHFYDACPVLSDNKELTTARLALISATKIILASSLNLCGIEAPEKM